MFCGLLLQPVEAVLYCVAKERFRGSESMKAFECDECGNLLFFENVQCVRCQSALGFLPDVSDLSVMDEAGENRRRAWSAAAKGRLYRVCGNQIQHGVCNWLISEEDNAELCEACRLN